MDDDRDTINTMQTLVEQLNQYAYCYYVLDKPIVSDFEYDKLYDQLLQLEKSSGVVLPDSPSIRVGGEPIKSFEQHKHRARLYSLDKVNSVDQLLAWCQKTNQALDTQSKYSLEYKIDGLTLCLTYDQGKFVSAATRGNGEVGEDVTAQVLTVKSIPLSVDYKGFFEVQGEGLIRLSQLQKYNQANQNGPIKNARNGVAGAIRNLDPKVTAKRSVDIYFYNVNYIDTDILKSQEDIFEFLRANKFKTLPPKFFVDCNQMVDEIHAVDRQKLDFLIDGMVIKVNDLQHRQKLGYTIKFPKWAVAYKFDALEVSTTVLDVVWRVGRTGRITPSAILSPVDIGGVTVKKATLNNYDDIVRKNVGIGSTVFLRRSNDVIPEILYGVDSTATESVSPPTHCPNCGAKAVQDGVNYFCTSSNCAKAKCALLEHFVSKDCMDIEGISEKTIEQLYSLGLVREPYQFYQLDATKIEQSDIEGFKDKKTKNLLKNLEKSKTVSLDRFIHALGIPLVGKKTSRDLAAKFGSIQKLQDADIESLVSIPDIGDTTAKEIVEYFKDKNNVDAIAKFAGFGINPVANAASGKLTGLKFVITGTLSSPRSHFAKLIVDLGGEVGDSVTKDTDYLLVGADAGSKLDKANKLGIKVIDQEEFELLIKG